MSLFGMFKRKKSITQENIEVVRRRIAQNQEAVYNAVRELNTPCTGRMVAKHLEWDSASVTNRLSELNKKGRIKIAYNKRGLDGIWRHYYIVSDK